MRRVVVTGVGVLSPVGSTFPESWKAIVEGQSGVGQITQFDVTGYSSTIAGEVKNFRPEDFIPTKEIKKMDRFIQLCLGAADEAVKTSGVDWDGVDRRRVGACIGVGIGGLIDIQKQYKEVLERGARRISPFFIPAVIGNLAPGHLSLKYGLKGPNFCLTSACSSSAHAIGESMRMIQRGQVDMMLAGGSEAAICELGVGGFCAMRALSTRNDEPTRASRPFDKDRDGFVIGEGAAVLMLEELEHAKKRSAMIYGEVIGYGINSDAHHMTQPSPDGEGAGECMKLALDDAKISPDKIDYVNAHGTSTPLGDAQESLAIARVFGVHAKKLAVSSTKSMTGHLLGAAGAIEAAFCLAAIRDGVAPPTINLENPSDDCDLDYVPNKAQQRTIHTAISNSFGFGGTNASLVFSRFVG